MLKRTIQDYIFFGTALRYLQDATSGMPLVGDLGKEGSFALGNIRSFLLYLEEFELHVTSRASRELRRFLKELEELPKDHKLTAEEANRLTEIMNRLRPTLMAEAEGNVALIVTDKRIDVEKLLDDVAALLAPGTFARLPDIAQYDFSESGKCIAFERPTAAAFHCLRSTEGVLCHYHSSLVENAPSDLSWGAMVTSLRQSGKNCPNALLSMLDNIRNSFRNPTAHPEARYDISEVQDLFNLCVHVVNRMVKDLADRGLT